MPAMLLPLLRSLAGYVLPWSDRPLDQDFDPSISASQSSPRRGGRRSRHTLNPYEGVCDDAETYYDTPQSRENSYASISSDDGLAMPGKQLRSPSYDAVRSGYCHCEELNDEMEALRRQVVELSFEVQNWIQGSQLDQASSERHRSRSKKKRWSPTGYYEKGMLIGEDRRCDRMRKEITKRRRTSWSSESSISSNWDPVPLSFHRPPLFPQTPPLTTRSSSASSSSDLDSPSSSILSTSDRVSIVSENDYYDADHECSIWEDGEDSAVAHFRYQSSLADAMLFRPVDWIGVEEASIDSSRPSPQIHDDLLSLSPLQITRTMDDLAKVDENQGLDVFGPVLFTTSEGSGR